MQSVTTFFKEENDFLYKKGLAKGRNEENFKYVANLIAQTDFPDEQIAGIVEVPLSFVKSIRDGLKKQVARPWPAKNLFDILRATSPAGRR
jgi:hypothetical protein